MVFAEGCYGIFHLAEYFLLVGVNIKNRPPGIGTRRQILAECELIAHRYTYRCWGGGLTDEA
jgi:hypothetical protein